MKAKFIKSIVIAIILILGVGCVSLPFFFRPNEKAIAETLDPERVDWVLLDGNVPVALHYENNGQKSFLTPGTTIPLEQPFLSLKITQFRLSSIQLKMKFHKTIFMPY